MATIGEIKLSIELPEGFNLMPESVQLAIVEKLSANWQQTVVVKVDSASLVEVMRSQQYRNLRSN